jgi:PAS domain-containing protein
VRDVVFSASVVGRFLIVTLIDVTQQRQAERSLQATTERMRLAAVAAGFGFWTRDLDAEIEKWDDQMLTAANAHPCVVRGRSSTRD